MRVRQPGDHLFLPSALDRHRADCAHIISVQAENLFFGKDGSVTFIDFQLSVVQWAAMDVAYCLGQSVEPEVRRKHELEYLEMHYESLLAHPNGPKAEDYTWNHHLAVRAPMS
eukprot:COSAG04_NODE_12490_length_650_cov_0.923775_2_plen_113_part_00